MQANFEKAGDHFKEGMICIKRAKRDLLANDPSGSIHASQNAVEQFIKAVYTVERKEPPKVHDPRTDFPYIIQVLRQSGSSLIGSNVFEIVSAVGKDFEGLHTVSQYGKDGKTASQTYSQEDALRYYNSAREIVFPVMAIVMVYAGHARLLPKELDSFFDENIEKRK
jgi:HEPN domain-containing protein